jgi:HD-GYP domain-containing protein (c-di-GMP phosphodiesterase class II)
MDIYDALTARDRPYKVQAPHEAAVKILLSMADEGKLDGEVVRLFIESGIGADELAGEISADSIKKEVSNDKETL